MENLFIHQLSALEDEFLEPSPSPKPITASGYELHPGIIAMVRGLTFSGLENEDPAPSFARVRGTVLVLGNPRYDTENLEVEVVPFLSHGEGGIMVHSQCEECER
jgi:hypothetical protein